MKNRFFLVLALTVSGLALMSCNHSEVYKKTAGSDSLVITFTGADGQEKTVHTTEKNAIRRIGQFIDATETTSYKCGVNGKMAFYSHGELMLPVVFQYKNAECRHFLFDLDGKTVSTTLNNEAADFFSSMEQGKLFY